MKTLVRRYYVLLCLLDHRKTGVVKQLVQQDEAGFEDVAEFFAASSSPNKSIHSNARKLNSSDRQRAQAVEQSSEEEEEYDDADIDTRSSLLSRTSSSLDYYGGSPMNLIALTSNRIWNFSHLGSLIFTSAKSIQSSAESSISSWKNAR